MSTNTMMGKYVTATKDTSGNVVGINVGDGITYDVVDYTATLFVNLPDPTTVQAGIPHYVSNVGVGGSQWYSDGVRWRALGGTVVLKNNYTDANTVANTNEQILDQFLIPAGLIKIGDIVRVKNRNDKSSTVDTCTTRLRLGTAGTVADANISQTAQPATTSRTMYMLKEFVFVSATSVRRATMETAASTGASTAIAADVTVSNVSNALYLSLTTQMTTGAETMTLKDFIIELDTCGN